MIATDGSDFSKKAAEKACEMFGERKDAEFLVVSVFEDAPIPASEPFTMSPEYYQQILDLTRQQVEKHAGEARELIESLVKEARVSVDILRGKPSARIVERAESWGADLVVVGSHGRGFWGRLLGSVSNSVVNHASCSVLVVRSKHEE